MATNRRPWIKACKTVSKLISDAKSKHWRTFAATIDIRTDPRTVFRTIRSLGGGKDASAPNEAIQYEGRTLTDDKQKANGFLTAYAAKSKLKIAKPDRLLRSQVNAAIAAPTAPPPSCQDITKEEITTAISTMKIDGAAGPDDIHPRFLKNLPPIAIEFLQRLFNACWSHSVCPQAWKKATIIPLLKPSKPPSDIASYRPVSLTSCFGKALERIINRRLGFICEQNANIPCYQAGYRPLFSTEVQVLRVSQSVADGFQEKKPFRTVMTLIDYSAAFDKVWHIGLQHKMIQAGIPTKFVKRVKAFLQNRQNRVKIGSTLSRARNFRCGVPQGAVLSPILYNIYTATCLIL